MSKQGQEHVKKLIAEIEKAARDDQEQMIARMHRTMMVVSLMGTVLEVSATEVSQELILELATGVVAAKGPDEHTSAILAALGTVYLMGRLDERASADAKDADEELAESEEALDDAKFDDLAKELAEVLNRADQRDSGDGA